MEDKETVLLSQVLEGLLNGLMLPISDTETAGVGLSADERLDTAGSVLWEADLSWSREAQSLREVAVTSAEKPSPRLLRTLRIVDKQVTEIDRAFFHSCPNLLELTLTGNLVRDINPDHIPPSLQVLELCYNCLSSLEGLNQNPPPGLHHLGVGYNSIQHLQLTPSRWYVVADAAAYHSHSCGRDIRLLYQNRTSLLSLDMSYNLLCDLPTAVSTLTQLPHLRSLLLQGNPITLVPCYRGYVVDSLKELTVLDDEEITVSERAQSEGIALHCHQSREDITTALVEVKVTSVRGLPELNAETKAGTADSDGQMTRYFLRLKHTFLLENNFRKVTNDRGQDTDPALSHSQLLSLLDSELAAAVSLTGFSDQDLAPVAYSPDSIDYESLEVLYRVKDIYDLRNLLEQGVDVTIQLQRAVFTKDTGASSQTTGGRTVPVPSPKAEGVRSGRNTAQSGKKMDAKPVKGKGKGQAPPPSIPGEGWHVTSSAYLMLGKSHFDSSDLLDTKRCLTRDLTLPVSHDALQDCEFLAVPQSSLDEATEETNQQRDSPHIQLTVHLAVREYRDMSIINALHA